MSIEIPKNKSEKIEKPSGEIKDQSGLQEKPKTIRLDQDATMGDLFDAMHKIEDRAPSKEKNSGRFWVNMWNKFDPELFQEIMGLENRIWITKRKLPGKITDEDKELIKFKIMDFFESKGILPEDIHNYLPIEFKKAIEKRGSKNRS